MNRLPKGEWMDLNIFNSAAWHLIMQTDWMCKLILLGLFALSVYCIAVTALKYMILSKHKALMQEFLLQFKKVRTLQDLLDLYKNSPESLGGKLVGRLLTEVQRMQQSGDALGSGITQVAAYKRDYLEILVSQHIGTLMLEEERYLPMLGSSAAVSPLIGLFGTIWGLIHAFLDISKEKSADIATVAPGIAEALITTLAGLVVAIPAMIAFHYFSHELRRIESQLIDIGEMLLILMVQER